MKSNKLHIIFTIFLAVAVVVLASVLFFRGCEDERNESIADVSVNTEVSEVSRNTEASIGEVSGEANEEVSDDIFASEVSVPAEESKPSNDNSGNGGNSGSETSPSEEPSSEESIMPDNTQEDDEFITDEEVVTGNQLARDFIEEYFAAHRAKAPENGKKSFDGNEILDFYNEAYLLANDIYNGELRSHVAETLFGFEGFVLYVLDEPMPEVPCSYMESYHRVNGNGKEVLTAICDYYLAHYTNEVAYSLIPKDWILHNDKLYDYENYWGVDRGTCRFEEHYTVSKTETGYNIQVDFYVLEHYSDPDIYSIYCYYPYNGVENLPVSAGEQSFTYSLIKENGIWVFGSIISHIFENPVNPKYWEFTY